MKILILSVLFAVGSFAQNNVDVCDDILEGRHVEHPVAEVNKCYECDKKVPFGIKEDSTILSASNSALNAPAIDAQLGKVDGAWCAHPQDESPYLQVNFGKKVIVRRILLQGSHEHNAWVKKVRVQYKKKDEDSYEFIKEDIDSLEPTVFNGPINCDEIANIDLKFPTPTTAIRIFPENQQGLKCIRLEVEECINNQPEQTTGSSYYAPASLNEAGYYNRGSNYRLCRKTCEDCFPKCIKYKLDVNNCITCECLVETTTDEKFFEADILLTTETEESVLRALNPPKVAMNVPEGVQMGAGRYGKITRWNKRYGKEVIVPYDDGSMSSRGKQALQQAIQDFNRFTCIRLRRRTNERNFIQFIVGGGCFSPVGMMRSRSNQVSIGRGCEYKGTVIHETMHSLGFWHEQSRPDRDAAVTIQWQNIPSSVQYNFQKHSTSDIDSMGFSYDISSVMHYGSYAFSNSGRATITDKRGNPIKTQRNGMSASDYAQINKMYGCDDTGATIPPEVCTNGHKHCEYWAGVGECKKNPGYMLVNCKKACGGCGSGTTTPATTTTTTRRTTTTRKPTTTTTTKPTTRPTESGCVDKDVENCPIWANKYNMCNINIIGLKKICRKSCGVCGSFTTPPPLPSCKDKLTYCDGYKKLCKDPTYEITLKKYCQKTCNHC